MSVHKGQRLSVISSSTTGFRRVCMAVCLFVAMVTGIGCSSAPPEKRGSTLSQAADEAKKDSKTDKKKVLATTPKEEQEMNTGAAVATVGTMALADDSSTAPTTPEAFEPETNERFAISLLGGGGSVHSSEFDGFGAFGIGGSFLEKRIRGDLWLLYMPTSLTEQSGLVDALVSEREFAADLRFRYSFTPEYTFAGIYGLAGVRLGVLQWTYQNDVIVTDDNGNPQTIDDDRLKYYGGYLGVGIAPMQTDHFLLGIDFSVGLKLFDGYTHEGFKQDLFDDTVGFGQLLVSADYRF